MTVPYPFTRTVVAYPGQLPDVDPAWDIRAHRFWLGQAGQMIELPSADPGSYTSAQSRGEVEQGLASGSSGVTRFGHTMSRWSIAWQRLTGWERSVLDGFYRGAYGPGPFVYVPPEDRNRLTLGQSLCGSLNGAMEGWGLAALSGLLLYDATVAPAVAPCGVLRWSGANSGDAIIAGNVQNARPLPLAAFAAPYLPALPVTVALWAWTASGTAQVTLEAAGRLADGTAVASGAAVSTVTLTTTPQRVYATAQPATLSTSLYVTPELTCLTNSAPNILVSNAAMDYRDFPDDDWWLGSGVPRVHFAVDGRSGRSFDAHMNEPATITLVDAVTGRA